MPSVLGENALGHLRHTVPFASGYKEAPGAPEPEHWHATRIQEAEDAFDAFATPERAEACNARFIFPAFSRAQSNASHAQASYNSNTQLCHEWSSKQPDEEQIELAEPQRVLGHTMSDAKFANLQAQVAMLTDLLRNLAPTANAAKGPLCILAMMMIAVCVRRCSGRDVPKPVGGMRDKKPAEKAAGNAAGTGDRPDNVTRGAFGGVAVGNAGGTTEALCRAESKRRPPNPSGDGATLQHPKPFNTRSMSINVPQNPDSTGEDINIFSVPCPIISKTFSANTTGNAQIPAPAVPPLSDATSEPDNTSFPSPSPVEAKHSERPLNKRREPESGIKTESDGDVAASPGDGATKDDAIEIDSDDDSEVKPKPRKVQRVD
jgi:hypothetical protein